MTPDVPPSVVTRPVCRDLLDAGSQTALWLGNPANAPACFVADQLEFPLLQSLSHKFHLQSAESTLLLLLALQEIDAQPPGSLWPRIRTWADFASRFPDLANPRLLLPGNPLRHWNILQPARGRIEPLPLALAPLILSERILAYLLNDHTPDSRLASALLFALPPRILSPPQQTLAQAISRRWQSAAHFTDFQTVVLQGQDPDALLAIAGDAASQVRHQYKVHDEWGFAAKSQRGLNLTALFSGPSGTGKTLAAEVIANHLQLDLLRVDLSAVVSKYIGETEKHLSEVFDSAECGGRHSPLR